MTDIHRLDPRQERSRAAIRTALAAIMQEKDFSKITITEIVRRAGLSRPTFYLNYQTKEEALLDHLVIGFYAIVEQFNANLAQMSGQEAGRIAILGLYREVENNANLFRLLKRVQAENLLHRSLLEGYLRYLDEYAQRLGITLLPDVRSLSGHYLAGLTTTMIFAWLEQENPLTAAQVGEYVDRIILEYLGTVIRDRAYDDIFA